MIINKLCKMGEEYQGGSKGKDGRLEFGKFHLSKDLQEAGKYLQKYCREQAGVHLAYPRSRKEARVSAAKGQSGEGWETRLRGQMEWDPPWKVRRV